MLMNIQNIKNIKNFYFIIVEYNYKEINIVKFNLLKILCCISMMG